MIPVYWSSPSENTKDDPNTPLTRGMRAMLQGRPGRELSTKPGVDLEAIRCALIPSASRTWTAKRQRPLDLNLLMAPPNWNSSALYFQTRKETDGKLECKGHNRGLWFRFLCFATSVLNRKKKIPFKRLIK